MRFFKLRINDLISLSQTTLVETKLVSPETVAKEIYKALEIAALVCEGRMCGHASN
jgi:hypothetical protein